MSAAEHKVINTMTLPLLALRGLVVFPDMVLHFDVGREKSIKAIEQAMSENQLIFLVAQKDIRTDDPNPAELFRIGATAKVRQILKLPGDSIRVVVEGLSRARIKDISAHEPYIIAEVEELLPAAAKPGVKSEALVRRTQELFEEYSQLVPKMGHEIILNVISAVDPSYLADYIAQNTPLKFNERQIILEEINPLRRLEQLVSILTKEVEILGVERDIHTKVREQMEKNQKDYYLREQIKAIQNELGDREDVVSDSDEYVERILALRLKKEAEEKLLKEAQRLIKMSGNSAESAVIRTYLDTCLELPWNKTTKDRLDLDDARKILDREHFGLEKVKDRVVEFLAVKKLNPTLKSQILCLVGPPGVGKTSVAMSVAHAMKRKLARVSLGGVRDEADIRGHRKTYIGAMPGRIMSAVKQAGTRNSVILLDEIDKMGHDFRGDPAAAMLEVLDSEQNHSFRDHYIELPFDLSDVLFITTANTTETIPRPLLDRMELIELTSYTDEEKLEISKRHLIPKQKKNHGLKTRDLRISDDAVRLIISGYTRESGVRNLERELAAVCRKAAKKIASGEESSVTVTDKDVSSYLGVIRYKQDKSVLTNEIGVANGLAWTSVGGELLEVEANVVDGSGKIELTGNLGDVMKESAKAAVTYIRSRAEALDIDPDFYKNKDLHIHFPEGAIPKDGPSAGITMATVIISALTGSPVRRNIAMTGEITLRGRVLPIGGLKEKTMAAFRAGVRTVIIPQDNEADLEDIDKTVRAGLDFIPVETVDKVIDTAIDLEKRTITHKGSKEPAELGGELRPSGKPGAMPALRQ